MGEVLRSEIVNQVGNLLHGKSEDFTSTAIQLCNFQFHHNPVYREFLQLLNIHPSSIDQLEDIPFLPISFFKSKAVKTGNWTPKLVFESSGTTGQLRSRHFVRNPEWYEEVAVRTFEAMYGAIDSVNWIGLLPNYLEQKSSSLIYMLKCMIENSNSRLSGLFSNPDIEFQEILEQSVQSNKPTFLIGVSFALLELAENWEHSIGPNVRVMETGGMKGRREEITRNELHRVLKNCFGVQFIHSEYGMTELFSQAYSKKNGRFTPGLLMRVLCREINDPFSQEKYGSTGGLNIIDLANIDSCAFIQTMDCGRVYEDNTFEVLGRLDGSEERGCNLMYFN